MTFQNGGGPPPSILQAAIIWTTGMSKRRTPGSSLKGAELFKAIFVLEDLEKLSQGEEMEETVG